MGKVSLWGGMGRSCLPGIFRLLKKLICLFVVRKNMNLQRVFINWIGKNFSPLPPLRFSTSEPIFFLEKNQSPNISIFVLPQIYKSSHTFGTTIQFGFLTVRVAGKKFTPSVPSAPRQPLDSRIIANLFCRLEAVLL